MTWQHVLDVVRLLVISGGAFAAGLTAVVGLRNRSSPWFPMSLSFAALISVVVIGQATRLQGPPTWRLPIVAIAVAVVVVCDVRLLQREQREVRHDRR